MYRFKKNKNRLSIYFLGYATSYNTYDFFVDIPLTENIQNSEFIKSANIKQTVCDCGERDAKYQNKHKLFLSAFIVIYSAAIIAGIYILHQAIQL